MGGKKSSCILLLAAFAAFLRLGSAEGDPLPPSLVVMVRDSPISSIEDLKKLLDTDSVEEESDNQTTNEIHSSDAHHRVPRSLMASAEPALQAACKVRTEVLEVTRSMHDRTNAHFMLWPLCVEVQRCSGCCNSRTSQCVPVVTETRQLQMTKITYVNMRAHFEKVIIPVEDHVRCSCQPLTSPHAGRTSTARKPQATPPPPPAPRVAHKPPQPHGHTKEDLHRHDQLKQTQRLHLDERLGQERLWQNKYSPSHTAGEPPHHTPARRMDYQAPPHHHTTTTPHQHPGGGPADREGELGAGQMPPGAQPSLGDGGPAEDGRTPTLQHGSGDDSSRRALGGAQHQYHQQHPQQHQHQYQQQQQHQYQQQQQHPQHGDRLTVGEQPRHLPTQSGAHMLRDATTPHQPHHGPPYHHGQPDAPVYHHSQSDMAGQPHVQPEGSSHHSASEGSSPFDPNQSELTNGQRAAEDTEEERKRLHAEELERETDRQQEVKSQLHRHHHHHHQQAHPQSQPQTSTQRAVTDAPTTLQPASPSSRAQTTPRPPPLRRRRRKHRRRISKATMRAMIMVMS
ncbi:box A-binding factor isoform X2 [Alosa alosa]|uniref:box A-binding factor isoform X2 n=1 Tax=Alosa alosa TaxID=278164 RepID=UPI0020154B63|nr:box A-binding factor isoform X2 [Alosa alosa]